MEGGGGEGGRGGGTRTEVSLRSDREHKHLFPMAFLFLLLVMVPAAAFLDREKGLHFFTLPELRSPLHHALVKAGHGGKKWRALKAAPDGTYPEIHDSHEFVGATEYGFVSMNYSAIVKSTTVQTDDVR